uniref:NPL domain-containing protein n=1 Tax=Caenorhabditis tropicalis TaxID=1561998 RepID=A0A1I7UIB9_9PELO
MHFLQVQEDGYQLLFKNKCLTTFGSTDNIPSGNLSSHVEIDDKLNVYITTLKCTDKKDFENFTPEKDDLTLDESDVEGQEGNALDDYGEQQQPPDV